MTTRRGFLASLACVLAAPAARAQQKVRVVASFSIVGDFVRQIGGDRVELMTLVGPGGDAHVYAPTPRDAKALVEAQLIVVNGLGFEGWIDRLIAASGAKGAIVTVTRGVQTIAVAGGASGGHGHGHNKAAGVDPHAWQSIANAKIYVANIRDGLVAADPAGRAHYEARARDYLARLDALERFAAERFAALPKERRRIVTSHDAFGYLAAARELVFLAPRGVSTEAEPSARQVGELIRQIKLQKIRAVFVETLTDRRLIERIAKETGAVMGGTLYSDTLSRPDGPAASYEAMMRHNVETLTGALMARRP